MRYQRTHRTTISWSKCRPLKSSSIGTNPGIGLSSQNQSRGLHQSRRAEVITDAEFLYKGMTEWIAAWKQRGWRTSSGQAVANQELWQDIETAVARHRSVQ